MIEKKYNFVYQTKNLINGKTYIGVRCTDNLNDGYIGCGITSNNYAKRKIRMGVTSPIINAVVKYGYENFKREILCFFDTSEEAYEEEAWLVNEDWVNRHDNYNVALGGRFQTSTLKHETSKNHYSYISDIYVINISTKELVGCYHTPMDIERELGFNHSKIGNVLNNKAIKHKGHFFTRRFDNWQEDYENRVSKLKNFQKDNVKKIQKNVNINIKNENLTKSFNTIGECMEFLGLNPNGRTWFKRKIIKDGFYKDFKVWL